MTNHRSHPDQVEPTRVFMDHREYLVGVAYRILGQVTEAEDVAQET